jgi:hypothetical protein
MQQEQPGLSAVIGQQMNRTSQLPSELILKDFRRGLDYPCGCHHCRQRNTAKNSRARSLLAAIDVYDLPEAIEAETSEYFH